MSSSCWCCNKGEKNASKYFKDFDKSKVHKAYMNPNILKQIYYIKTNFPNLLKEAIKFPEAKFYNHGSSDHFPEPDLATDQQLQENKVPAGTLRNRQTELAEENLARKFLYWANNSHNMPCIILSSFSVVQYLKTLGCDELFDVLT